MLTETTVLIPKHDNSNGRTDIAESIFRAFVRYVSTHFGGCSVIEGNGWYLMNNGSLTKDSWWKVSIISSEEDKVDYCVTALVNTLCKELGQESVMVTYSQIGVTFAQAETNGDNLYAIV